MGLRAGANFLQGLENLGILRLQPPIHSHILGRIFAQEHQRVTYVIGLIDGFSDLRYHPCLGLRPNPGRRFNEYHWHDLESPSQMVITITRSTRTHRYTLTATD